MDWIKSLYDTASSTAQTKSIDFPLFDDFWEAGSVI